MKTLKYFTVLTVVAIFFISATCVGASDSLAKGATAESVETIITPDGRTFQFVRFRDSEGNPGSVWLDSSGNPVSESGLPPAAERSSIDSSLSYILGREPSDPDYIKDDEALDVVVALKVEDVIYNDPPEYGTVIINEDGTAVVTINGKDVDEKEIELNIKKRSERIAERREIRLSNCRNILQKLAVRNGLDISDFQKAIEHGQSSVKLSVTKGQIISFVQKNKDIISGIMLYVEPKKGLSDAMWATRIDYWALTFPDHRGNGIGIYMSESDGCCDPGHITNYTRLAGTADDHSENISAILRGVSPDSYVYCKSGGGLPTTSDLNGYNGNPAIYIENHSYYYNNGIGTDYTDKDRDFDNHIYDEGIAVFKSAGNLGGGTGNVTSPGKGLNVITVGNYDDSNNTIRSSSSFVNPQTKNEKPEIVAPGTSITAGGHTLTGTSMASPHAAAFAADFLSVYTWMQLRAHMVKAFMLAGLQTISAVFMTRSAWAE